MAERTWPTPTICSTRYDIAGRRGLQGSRPARFSRAAVAEGPTLWSKNPAQQARIKNALGWLTVPDAMAEQVRELASFADEVRDAGFRDIVLLGMGGSSQSAELFAATFPSAPGYPKLHVLDTTVPETISVARSQHRHHEDAVHRREQDWRDARNAVSLQLILRAGEGEVVESRGIAFHCDHRSGNAARGDRQGTSIPTRLPESSRYRRLLCRYLLFRAGACRSDRNGRDHSRGSRDSNDAQLRGMRSRRV